MTDTSDAWDGVPPNPEKEGWHWLRRRTGGAPEPWLWSDMDGGEGDFQWCEECGDGDPGTTTRWFEYLCPCLTPTEHRALLAERDAMERTDEMLRREIEALSDERDAALAEAQRMREALEEIERSHIPSQPMTEYVWAQMWVAHLRHIAGKALAGEARDESR